MNIPSSGRLFAYVPNATPRVAQQAFVLCAGLAIFAHIAFLAPALYFLSRAKLVVETPKVQAWVERHAGWLLWTPALLGIGIFLAMRPNPQDDLLAISAIAAGQFSHDGFAFSAWNQQPVSQWFGFEKVVAFAIQHLGMESGVLAIQTAAIVATAVSVTLAIGTRTRGKPEIALFAVFLVGLALASLTLGRAINGRVEAFFFAWAVAAVWMPAPVWLAIGLALTPTYWLAWIYAPAALLLRAPLAARLVIAAAFAIFAGAVWMYLSDGHYAEMFQLTRTWLAAREAPIMENVAMLEGIPASPAALALFAIAATLLVTGNGTRQDWPLAAVAIWFAMPDMLRYLPMIATLAAIWIAGALARGARLSWSSPAMLVALAVAAIPFATGPTGKRGADLPQFTLPAGAVALAPLDASLYATIHHNSGIKVSPSFELGATDSTIQKASRQLQAGEFDCALLRTYAIHYVIESRLREIPSCLTLDQVQGAWRLWRTSVPFKENAR